MKTTLILNDRLVQKIKAFAASEKTTVSAAVEALLVKGLEGLNRKERKKGRQASVKRYAMGESRVDISDRGALYDLMEEERS